MDELKAEKKRQEREANHQAWLEKHNKRRRRAA